MSKKKRCVALFQTYWRAPYPSGNWCPRVTCVTLVNLDAPSDMWSFPIEDFHNLSRDDRAAAIEAACGEAGTFVCVEAVHEIGCEIELTKNAFKHV